MNRILKAKDGRYYFECPGCKEVHVVGTSWKFNGNLECPTFTPSILVRSGCKTEGHKEGDNCWCTYNKECIELGKDPTTFKCVRCHSFITDGKIQFLNDCNHELAGKTVDLPSVS